MVLKSLCKLKQQKSFDFLKSLFLNVKKNKLNDLKQSFINYIANNKINLWPSILIEQKNVNFNMFHNITDNLKKDIPTNLNVLKKSLQLTTTTANMQQSVIKVNCKKRTLKRKMNLIKFNKIIEVK